MTHLAYIDTETTGLDIDRHRIWELALIIEGHENSRLDGEYLWQFPVDLTVADPIALNISGWYKRSIQWNSVSKHLIDHSAAWRVKGIHPNGEPFENSMMSTSGATNLDIEMKNIANLLGGAHLVGAVPDFDAYRLSNQLKRHHLLPTWHYHLVDIEATMVGYINGRAKLARYLENQINTFVSNVSYTEPVTLPWKSDALSIRIGVDPPSDDERHTALGDARWAKRVYERIMLE